MAKSSLGLSLNVDSTQSMGAPEFLKQRGEPLLLLYSQSVVYTYLTGVLCSDILDKGVS